MGGTSQPERFDVLVITALVDELRALQAVRYGGDGAWTAARDPDGVPYHHRLVSTESGATLRIAAAWTGDMGVTATALRAATLIGHLDPRCLSMCGICAGNRADVFLGDVIVADRVYSYDHGKLVASTGPDGQRVEQFFHDIETYNLDPTWRMDVAFFAENLAWSDDLARDRPPSHERQEAWIRHRVLAQMEGKGPSPTEHPDRRRCCPDWTKRIRALVKAGIGRSDEEGLFSLTAEGERLTHEERLLYPDHADGHAGDPPFRVHLGPIATGSAVQKDPEIFSRLERLVRKTIGIEMEAAAVGRVAEQLHRRAIIVKGVSDYGDSEKDDKFRAFAARASAEFLIRFLGQHLPARAPEVPVVPLAPPGTTGPAALGENPFQTAGTLSPGHPTYARRACDAELDAALQSSPLIALEGDFCIGKSSLSLRAHAELLAARRACYVDLQDLRTDDEHMFLRDFFRSVTRCLGRTVDSWPDLDDGAGLPPALVIDELGCLSPATARTFLPALHHYATTRKGGGHVIVCLRPSIKDFVKEVAPPNPKYREGWKRIRIGALESAGIDHLVALLPPRARAVAAAQTGILARLSAGHPIAVQRLCSALFEAEERGAGAPEMIAILGLSRSYE
jgi:nucleoside phosphorylase